MTEQQATIRTLLLKFNMAAILSNFGMLIGAIGLFFGFFLQSNHPQTSLEIVTVTTVGIVGVLAFLRHVIFHKSDAIRMGWETDRPDWMFEVGFANLAFGIMGLFGVFANAGSLAQALVLLGYATYLLQAALLHGYQYFTGRNKSPAKLWRSCLATILYAGMMSFFAINALLH
jgi:hypothetical protein